MLLTVTVKPNSKKGPLVVLGSSDSRQTTDRRRFLEATVFLRERPVDGAANDALIKTLSEFFRVPKICINIKTGNHSRKKIVEIIGKVEKL